MCPMCLCVKNQKLSNFEPQRNRKRKDGLLVANQCFLTSKTGRRSFFLMKNKTV